MKIKNVIARFWLRYRKVKWRGSSPHFTHWHPFLKIRSDEKGYLITIGSHCRFGINARLDCFGGQIKLGNNCAMNDGARISCTSSVVLGDYSRMAPGSVIMDDSFHDLSPEKRRKKKGVIIGRNVWIATNAIILPGVEIRDHSVVAAGAVVTKSFPDRCVIAGNPAKIIDRFECPDNWIRDKIETYPNTSIGGWLNKNAERNEGIYLTGNLIADRMPEPKATIKDL